MDYIEKLNNEQKKAATFKDGPCLVIAGAGSGKTKVLTTRIANLIENGVKPYNILAITFTNKAAGEMRERVNNIINAHDTFIGTFVAVFWNFAIKSPLESKVEMIDDTEARIEEKEKEILRLQEEIEELKERELQD